MQLRQVALRVAQRASSFIILSTKNAKVPERWLQRCTLSHSRDLISGKPYAKAASSTCVGEQAWRERTVARGMATATTPTHAADGSQTEIANEMGKEPSMTSGSSSSLDKLRFMVDE